MAQYAAAVDQGTTSTRFMVFDHGGQVVSVDQKEHEQIFPKPGWVEHDPMEIWQRTQEVIHAGLDKVQASSSVRVAVPIVEAVADTTIPGQGTLLVLGVDLTGDRSLRDYDLESGDESVIGLFPNSAAYGVCRP